MVTQADVDRLRWFHDFDFPGGLKARSSERDFVVPRRLLTWFVSEQLRAIDLVGKSVVDVVFFFGVYYHLHAPYAGFAQLRALCHDDTIVVVEGECLRDDERSYAAFDLDDPRTPSFTPTSRLLVEMLRSCYFEVERLAFVNDVDATEMLGLVPPEDVLRLVARHLRIRRSRKGRTADAPPAPPLPTPERVVIFARPVRGRNRHHQYRPPFSLDRFDVPDQFAAD